MAAKRLEDGSEYAEYDADGDGIVTDEELQTSKELQELRLQHERADAQRAMSWFALWGMLLYPSLVVVSEFFGMNQAASILGDMAAVYFVSVAAAGMLLQQINTVIQNVNEGKANVQQAMALVSDFGEALNSFEVERKSSAFNALSKNDILKLQMLRRSQERYQKDLRDLLLVADPKLLEDYDRGIRQQEHDRRAHAKLVAKRKRERQILIQQVLVGGTTLIVGGGLAIFIFVLILKAFG